MVHEMLSMLAPVVKYYTDQVTFLVTLFLADLVAWSAVISEVTAEQWGFWMSLKVLPLEA
eukprot:14694271-Ditylum_brightwellii.AAC.1